jgi:hypothetical protein
MQRFSTWAGWIAAILAVVFFIIKDVVAPVVVDFIKKQPETDDAIHAVLKSLLDLIQHPWLQVAGWIFVGLAAGFWLDWLLRKLDGSRADRRKKLGIDMLKLAHNLSDFAGRIDGDPMNAFRPQITSCLTKAEKLGMWKPDNRIFSVHPPQALDLIMDYLTQVGTMLKDGNFREAKRDAKNSKAAFDKAYAQHRLT